MTSSIKITRRNLLGATVGLVAAAGLNPRSANAQAATPAASPAAAAPAASTAKPLPSYVSWKHADSMIIHTPTPIETKRSAIGSSIITPSDRLFIRNNLPAPSAADIGDVNAWKVTVEGVGKPQALSIADLKQMGFETMATVLQWLCTTQTRAFMVSLAVVSTKPLCAIGIYTSLRRILF